VVHQRTSDLLLAAARPLTRANLWRHRLRAARRTEQAVHLGCVNVDAHSLRRVDMWLDVRDGLPFRDGAVRFVYTVHLLEHLYPDEVRRLLRECHRVLARGGGMRIVVPNMGTAIQAYLAGRGAWFSDFPRAQRSPGGRLANYLFCDGQHRNGFDFGHLAEVLAETGFTAIEERRAGESRLWDASRLAPGEGEEDAELPRSLYVETVK
jgi:prepilin-type processing-associated H-X9-DG protein